MCAQNPERKKERKKEHKKERCLILIGPQQLILEGAKHTLPTSNFFIRGAMLPAPFSTPLVGSKTVALIRLFQCHGHRFVSVQFWRFLHSLKKILLSCDLFIFDILGVRSPLFPGTVERSM